MLGRMENLEEGDEGGGFCRTEVFAVGVHIAATLDDLANEHQYVCSCPDDDRARWSPE